MIYVIYVIYKIYTFYMLYMLYIMICPMCRFFPGGRVKNRNFCLRPLLIQSDPRVEKGLFRQNFISTGFRWASLLPSVEPIL